MRIAIVGASGFIGGVVSRYFVCQGRSISVVYRNEPAGAEGWWNSIEEKIKGDICDERVLDGVVELQPEVCIYLVSLNHRESAGPMADVTPVNVLPAWGLLERLAGMNWKGRFIYMSTQQVYGRNIQGSVNEETPVCPSNYYGLTHRIVEQLCLYFRDNHGLDAVSVRLSNSYGVPAFRSNDCWWTVVNELVNKAAQERVLTLHSDGSPVRDIVYVEDVARFLELFLFSRRGNEAVINLGSGETYSIYRVARTIQQEYEARSGFTCPIVRADGSPVEELPENPGGFIYDTGVARSHGFRPGVDLRTGINRILDYLEDA